MTERRTLEKSISFINYVSIGLGAIIGIGWVIYAGQWIQDGGPVGAILAFLICGLLLLPIGACYAEMTSAIPVAGGELAFTFKAFGSLVAFLTAWALSLDYVATTAFETIAIGALLEAILPSLAGDPFYSVDGYRVSLLTMIPGLVAGLFLIWLNYKGAKSSARFQLWVMYLLLLCTMVFTATALSKGSFSNLTPMFAGEGSFWAIAPSSIIAVLVVAPWFMSGFDTIPQAAEESGVKMKPKQLGIAILTSIIMGAVFYALIVLAVGMSISPLKLSILLQKKDMMPTAEVFRVAFGYEWTVKLVLFAALLGLLTTLNGFYVAASRLLFSLGRGGMLPHWFARVHATHGTPSNAILFVGAVSLIGPFVGRAALRPIVDSSALAFTAALFLTALSVIRLRRIASYLERPYRTHMGVLYLGAAVSAALVLMMVIPGSPGLLSPLELSIIGGWTALGLLGYLLQRARGGMGHDERSRMILGAYR